MKLLKILLPVFMGTFVYTVLGICVGPRGIWPMHQLEHEKASIVANLEQLSVVNENLDSQFHNFCICPRVRIYSRK